MSNRPKPDNFFACGASFGRDNTLQLQYIRDLHQARSPSIGVLADGAAANPDAHFTNSPPGHFRKHAVLPQHRRSLFATKREVS
jgi:hypothetical protein